jgi:hypothetical protein
MPHIHFCPIEDEYGTEILRRSTASEEIKTLSDMLTPVFLAQIYFLLLHAMTKNGICLTGAKATSSMPYVALSSRWAHLVLR